MTSHSSSRTEAGDGERDGDGRRNEKRRAIDTEKWILTFLHDVSVNPETAYVQSDNVE